MVTLALAKQHLEYEASDRDSLIQQYIDASEAWVENFTGKNLTVKAAVQTERTWGGYVELDRGPFVSLTSVAYTDPDDTPATVTGARVIGARIYAPVAGWPSVADDTLLTFTYQAGYATVPADLVSAQLLLIGHLFAHREAVNIGNIVTTVPLAVEALCGPYRDVRV